MKQTGGYHWECLDSPRPAPEQRPQQVAPGGLAGRLLSALTGRYSTRNERLTLCETISLGNRRTLALIECDGQPFLVGMSAGGVETLMPVSNCFPLDGVAS